MSKGIKERKKKLTEEQDIIFDAWQQWAYESKGGYWSGGLSTLEYIESYLKEKGILTKRGNFNKKEWERE